MAASHPLDFPGSDPHIVCPSCVGLWQGREGDDRSVKLNPPSHTEYCLSARIGVSGEAARDHRNTKTDIFTRLYNFEWPIKIVCSNFPEVDGRPFLGSCRCWGHSPQTDSVLGRRPYSEILHSYRLQGLGNGSLQFVVKDCSLRCYLITQIFLLHYTVAVTTIFNCCVVFRFFRYSPCTRSVVSAALFNHWSFHWWASLHRQPL